MAIRKANVVLNGTTDILLHNGQTADPRNQYAKAMKMISGKRKKTDADLDQLAKVEWFAGLYLGKLPDGSVTTVLPSHVLESAFIAGAKKSKRGVQTKSGLFVDSQAVLNFEGKPEGQLDETALKDSLDALYEAGQHHLTVGVKVSTSKVMRTRPKFSGWSAECQIEFDDAVMTFADVQEVIEDAGRLVGVGDWRPKFGRFASTVTEV
jgi:hypothetical protein